MKPRLLVFGMLHCLVPLYQDRSDYKPGVKGPCPWGPKFTYTYIIKKFKWLKVLGIGFWFWYIALPSGPLPELLKFNAPGVKRDPTLGIPSLTLIYKGKKNHENLHVQFWSYSVVFLTTCIIFWHLMPHFTFEFIIFVCLWQRYWGERLRAIMACLLVLGDQHDKLLR